LPNMNLLSKRVVAILGGGPEKEGVSILPTEPVASLEEDLPETQPDSDAEEDEEIECAEEADARVLRAAQNWQREGSENEARARRRADERIMEALRTEMEEREKEKRAYRVQGRRFLFTYATHLPKEEFVHWFQQLTHRIPVFIRLAHETGDETVPYNHTHVLIDMGTVFNKRDATEFFDFPAPPEYVDRNGVARSTIHPNIKNIPSAKAFDDAKGYLSKEDAANQDLACFVRRSGRDDRGDRSAGGIVDTIWASPTVQDALRQNVGDVREAAGVLQIYQHRPEQGEVDAPLAREELWKWQLELVDEVHGRAVAHNGKVIWYYDPEGQHGKGRVQEYLEETEKDESGNRKWLCIAGSCSSRHVMLHAHNERRAGWTGHGVCIDVTRTRAHNDELYTIIELFLNGRWTVSMYNTGRGRICTPWVVVFANFWPRIDALSTSRWILRELVGDQGKEPIVTRRSIRYNPGTGFDSGRPEEGPEEV
jgi:hypothetical protein